MITLAKKIKEEKERREKGLSATEPAKGSRASIRDKLLTKGLTSVLLEELIFVSKNILGTLMKT